MPITPVGDASSSGTVVYYENLIAGKWGYAAGEAYVSYADANSQFTPRQAAEAYTEIIVSKGLKTALTAGLGGSAEALGQIPGAAAKGANQVYQNLDPAQWLNKLGNFFSSRSSWVRIAEGVLGLALVLVAVSHLAEGTAVGNVVKKVPFI